MIRTLIPMTDGSEEMEAVIMIDVLRRAGWTVVTAGVPHVCITASRGVRLQTDTPWAEVESQRFDLLALPGGMQGVRTLAAHPGVREAVRRQDHEGRWLAAICAGPLVLQAAEVIGHRRVTCHPAIRGELRNPWCPDRVVVDGHLVTSQGPGTALEFALTLVRVLGGRELARTVASEMVVLPETVEAVLK